MPLCAIVGAGEGLGQALASKFAQEGHNLALISRSEAGSRVALNSARKANAEADVRFFTADANQPQTIEDALTEVHTEMGKIDVLIYNVRDSFIGVEPSQMSYEQLESVYRTEVVGAFAAAKSVIPDMRKRGSGSIFFSSATAAFRGSASNPLYAIGKFALRGLSQSLAKAYSKDGIHVVHVRLDCDLNMPLMRKLYGDNDTANLASPEAVAETYWWTHKQPTAAWSNEVELRPHTEAWTF